MNTPVKSILRLLLLLLVTQPPHTPWGMQKTKCLFSVIKDSTKEFNYFKPGDYQIGGLISTTNTIPEPYVFSKPPAERFTL